MENINLSIGLAIRKLREEKGVTARELGENSGFKDYELSKIERGLQRLDLAGALRVTEALGVTLNEFADIVRRIEPQTAAHKEALEHAAKARKRLRELVKSLESA